MAMSIACSRIIPQENFQSRTPLVGELDSCWYFRHEVYLHSFKFQTEGIPSYLNLCHIYSTNKSTRTECLSIMTTVISYAIICGWSLVMK